MKHHIDRNKRLWKIYFGDDDSDDDDSDDDDNGDSDNGDNITVNLLTTMTMSPGVDVSPSGRRDNFDLNPPDNQGTNFYGGKTKRNSRKRKLKKD